MAVDLTVCEKRVIQILNASTRDGSGNPLYASAVDDQRRNLTNIQDAVKQSARLFGQAYCETDAHPSRASFIALTTVTHGATLPEHYGSPGRPQIEPYAGAGYRAGVWRPAAEIESFRENPENIYDAIDHDQEGSTLGGFYDFVGDAIVFTGLNCQVPLATFTDGNIASKLPASSEAGIIRVAVGLVKTEGDSQTLDEYARQGQNDLAQIRGNAETVKPVELAEKAA